MPPWGLPISYHLLPRRYFELHNDEDRDDDRGDDEGDDEDDGEGGDDAGDEFGGNDEVDAELRNVNSFTRSKTLELNFTPRKARKSRQFWDLSETKLTKMIVLENKC